MRIRLVLVVLIGCVLWGGVSVGQAQDTSAPIILLINGDLWSWHEGDAELQQLTDWGHNFDLLISPDGKRVAYFAISKSEVNAEGQSGQRQTDIWVLDIASSQTTQLAEESLHLMMAWSPDGTKLVWTEYSYVQGRDHPAAIVHDFQTGETFPIIQDLPDQCFYDIPAIDWGKSGFVVRNDTCGEKYPISFQFYDTSGTLLSSLLSTDRDFGYTWEFVSYEGQEYFAVLYEEQWLLFDPYSAQPKGIFDVLQAYSPSQPDTALDVTIVQDTNTFALSIPSSVPSRVNIGSSPDNFTFSADGKGMAYRAYGLQEHEYIDAINIVRDGFITQYTWAEGIPDDFGWETVAWRVKPDSASADQTIPDGMVCPGALPPRLSIGEQAHVIPGSGANNLRLSNFQNADLIGTIPENGMFTVEDGPTCSDGILWWYVNYNGQSGWTAEGQGDTYFLEPNE